MIKKLNNFKKLNLRQWWWFFLAYWKLVWVEFSLIRSKGSVRHLLKSSGASQGSVPQANILNVADELFESVRLASRCHWWQPACLPRSLVLQNMLNKYAIQSELKVGVNKQGQVFASHAWIEVNGKVIGESEQTKKEFIEIETV